MLILFVLLFVVCVICDSVNKIAYMLLYFVWQYNGSEGMY